MSQYLTPGKRNYIVYVMYLILHSSLSSTAANSIDFYSSSAYFSKSEFSNLIFSS